MKKLELNQMEVINGGGNPLTDAKSCNTLANGIGGFAVIFGTGAWWTGAGAIAAVALSIGSYGYSLYCQSL